MTKVRGVKEGKELTASFDGRGKKAFKGNLQQTSVLVLLSIVGNEYCSGDYLQAIVEHAITNHHKVTLLIADGVHWNNLKGKGDISPEQINVLKNEALKLGDEFIQKNLTAFLQPLKLTVDSFVKQYGHLSVDKQLAIINNYALEKGLNVEIVRWQEWVANPAVNYLTVTDQLQGYYESETLLKQSIEIATADFARRHHKNNKNEDEALWLERSRSYLKEESPAVIWLAAKLGYQFIAYPGEMIEPFKATKEFFVRDELEQALPEELMIVTKDSLVNWLDINFKRSHPKQTNIHKAENVGALNLNLNNFSFFKEKSLNSGNVNLEDCTRKLEDYVRKMMEDVEAIKAVLADPTLNATIKLSFFIETCTKLNQKTYQLEFGQNEMAQTSAHSIQI